jgi:hypothetical protein
MNVNEASFLIPILQAFVGGKAIQYSFLVDDQTPPRWQDMNSRDFDSWHKMLNGNFEFRVKPKPKWRPWTKDEVPKILMIRCLHSHTQHIFAAQRTPNTYASLVSYEGLDQSEKLCMPESLLAMFVHVHEDGSETPCGILLEE